MKLYFSHSSPYARKARVVMYEAGLEASIEQIAIIPWEDPEGYRDHNPFGKVPTLVLGDGTSLFQSNTICEYLDHLNTGAKLFPKSWDDRLSALRLLSFADNILDSCILQRMEQLFHADTRSEKLYERQNWSINMAIDALEREADGWADRCDIGLIAVACALGYRDFRFADHNWRDGHSTLADWYAVFIERPSFVATPLDLGS